MELTFNIDYEQLLHLISQLPEEQQEKLLEDLQKKSKTKPSSKAKKSQPLTDLQKLLLQAPTWTDEEYQQYKEAKKHLNQFRTQ